MMKKFWELFEQSIITQAVVTLVLVVTVAIMFIKGQPIPELLQALVTLVLGFWFGSKIGYTQAMNNTKNVK